MKESEGKEEGMNEERYQELVRAFECGIVVGIANVGRRYRGKLTKRMKEDAFLFEGMSVTGKEVLTMRITCKDAVTIEQEDTASPA